MENTYFYKYNNKEFVFASNYSKIGNKSDSIIIFKTIDDAKIYSKVQNNFGCGVMSNSPDVLSFWTNKKIDFIINPFDFKGKGFDKKIFSLIKQNNILPVILLGKIINSDKDKQIQIFKHLIAFNKLCVEFKLPIAILYNNQNVANAFYSLMGYNDKQAERFLKRYNDVFE